MSVRHFGLAPGRYITDVQISYDHPIIITGSSAFVYTVKLQDTAQNCLLLFSYSAHMLSSAAEKQHGGKDGFIC